MEEMNTLHGGGGTSPYMVTKRGSIAFNPICLCWRDVYASVRVKKKKRRGCCGIFEGGEEEKPILKGVSGITRSGTLLAIMGASGAGKTTLMNIITGRNIKLLTKSGDIFTNGIKVGRAGMKNVSAYVQQDDLFIGTLTVREQLQFHALLRMDRDLKTQQRLMRVEEVIVEMGLASCANCQIGQVYGSSRAISGGERKRLSFACEALTNMPLMFCDEPTSGLDTFMAQNTIHVLKMMAAKGHTVLCTIHQPSSEIFAMFDRILLLSEGKTAYCGSSKDALHFFTKHGFPCPSNYNPADFFIHTLAIKPGYEEVSKARSKIICDMFSQSPAGLQIRDDVEQQISKTEKVVDIPLMNQVSVENLRIRFGASYFAQTRYLFWRSWITIFRNDFLFKIRFIQSFVVALLFGSIYFQLRLDQKGVMNTNGAIFVLLMSITFSNLFDVLNTFPVELDIFMRDRGSGLYRTDVYFLTKSLSEIPMFLMISLIFVSVAYWMIGLYPYMDAFLWAQLIYFVTASVGMSFGYFISALCGDVTLSLAVAPPLIIPAMLFGGLFINDADVPFYFGWLKYLSWFRYANEILQVNQWQHVHHIDCAHATHNSSLGQQKCFFRNGADVLEYSSFSEDDVMFDIGMLVVLLVGFRVLAFFALLIKARKSNE